MHSKIYNHKKKNAAQIELERIKAKRIEGTSLSQGQATNYRNFMELKDVAAQLGINGNSFTEFASLFKTVTSSQRFVELKEEEIVLFPISGKLERMLTEALKKQKEVHYSFMKEIEDL